MIEVLGSLAYSTVEHSWKFSTVFVKYLLVIGLFYSVRDREDVLRDFREFVLDYSREAVTVVVLIGAVSAGIGYSFSPLLVEFSSLVAVSYFGYLFWKF